MTAREKRPASSPSSPSPLGNKRRHLTRTAWMMPPTNAGTECEPIVIDDSDDEAVARSRSPSIQSRQLSRCVSASQRRSKLRPRWHRASRSSSRSSSASASGTASIVSIDRFPSHPRSPSPTMPPPTLGRTAGAPCPGIGAPYTPLSARGRRQSTPDSDPDLPFLQAQASSRLLKAVRWPVYPAYPAIPLKPIRVVEVGVGLGPAVEEEEVVVMERPRPKDKWPWVSGRGSVKSVK